MSDSDSAFKITADAKSIAEEINADLKATEKLLLVEFQQLGIWTKDKAIQLSKEKIKAEPLQKRYEDNLEFEQLSPTIWVVSLDADALPIEEGQEEKMNTDKWLLKGKGVKNGSKGRYKVIPFLHSQKGKKGFPKKEITSNKYMEKSTNEIKSLMNERKARGQDYIDIEKIKTVMENGKPKEGKIHAFDLARGNPSDYPTPRATNRKFTRMNIYQTVKNGKVRHDILTFRTVSENSENWVYPHKAVKIIDEVFKLAEARLENEILPQVKDNLKNSKGTKK